MSDHLLQGVIASLVYAVLGLGVLVAGYFVVRLIFPFSINKEIEQDQNTALGVVIGSFILGLSIIIAAAIHG